MKSRIGFSSEVPAQAAAWHGTHDLGHAIYIKQRLIPSLYKPRAGVSLRRPGTFDGAFK